MDYVAAARTMGAGNATIMSRVILPNAIPPLVIVATLTISSAILFESGLSFLGLGDPNIMTWGMIIGSNKDYIMNSWWAVTFPGLAIFLVVLAIGLIGDGINDAFNPACGDASAARKPISKRGEPWKIRCLKSGTFRWSSRRRWGSSGSSTR